MAAGRPPLLAVRCRQLVAMLMTAGSSPACPGARQRATGTGPRAGLTNHGRSGAIGLPRHWANATELGCCAGRPTWDESQHGGALAAVRAKNVLAGYIQHSRIARIAISGAMAAQQRLSGPAALPALYRAVQGSQLHPDSKMPA